MQKNQMFSVPHQAMNEPGLEKPRAASGRENEGTSRLFASGCTHTKPWQARGNAKAVFFFLLIPLLLFAGPALSYDGCDFEISIQVSPNIVNLQSRSMVLTVHTDIDYDEVYPQSVYLVVSGDQGDQNVTIASWKADTIGYFVANIGPVRLESTANLKTRLSW